MEAKFTDLEGNWHTSGRQDGWSHPVSGAWQGNLVLKGGGNSTMRFTEGNVAKSRNGNWIFANGRISIVDTEGTEWVGSVSPDLKRISGSYDSGPAGAAGGKWQATRL